MIQIYHIEQFSITYVLQVVFVRHRSNQRLVLLIQNIKKIFSTVKTIEQNVADFKSFHNELPLALD